MFVERRKLGQLETQLGLLGWQQADYDPGTQHHVDRLTDYERTQGQLTNESAAFGLALQQLEERRVAERETFDKQKAERVAAREPVAASAAEGEKELETLRSEKKRLEDGLAALDKELAGNEQQYRALLAKGLHNEAEHKEVTQLQGRSISIPLEKKEWQEKLDVVAAALGRQEVEVRQRQAMLSVATEAVQTVEKSFADTDAALLKEIAQRKRDKLKLERQVEDLEKAKAHPYREIGRALANHGIEPVNQPDALHAVLAQREKIGALEAKVAASLERSRAEKRSNVWSSWLLLATFAGIFLLAIWLVLHPH